VLCITNLRTEKLRINRKRRKKIEKNDEVTGIEFQGKKNNNKI
jgi:hypothetical protein